MKKVLKIIGIILLIIIVLIILLIKILSKIPSVPDDYVKKVQTGGDIEAKYLAIGGYEVEHLESVTFSSLEKFEVYYPKILMKWVKYQS